MRTNPRTLLATAAAGLALLFSASACAGTSTGSSGPGANSSPTAVAIASPIVCQTSAPELYIYLEGDKSMFSQAGSPAALDDPTCVDKFAVTQVKVNGGGSGAPEYVLFSFDVQNTKWTVVAVGAAGICAGKIPDALAKLLPGCVA